VSGMLNEVTITYSASEELFNSDGSDTIIYPITSATIYCFNCFVLM